MIRADHVIVDMLLGLGASVRSFQGAFSPESGAYAESSTPAGRHALLLVAGSHHHGHHADE